MNVSAFFELIRTRNRHRVEVFREASKRTVFATACGN